MAYAIFNSSGHIYKIAANDTAKNNLNLSGTETSITITDNDFNNIRLGKKYPVSHANGVVTYEDEAYDHAESNSKANIKASVEQFIKLIDFFTEGQPNHPDKTTWVNFQTFLKGINYDSITWPLTKSIYEYIEVDLSTTSYNPLQLP